jgi:hypothetical protein
MSAQYPRRALKALVAFTLGLPLMIIIAPLLAFLLAQGCWRNDQWPQEVLSL